MTGQQRLVISTRIALKSPDKKPYPRTARSAMRRPQYLTTLSTGIYTLGAILLGTGAAIAQSTSLNTLPVAKQEEISRICLPVQFREGAAAYRNCVQSEIGLQARVQPSSSTGANLAVLTFDDKYAVQQACASAGGQSGERYQACVAKEVSELNDIPTPDFEGLAEHELYAVQQSCFTAQSKEGAARYRRCLNAEVQSLRSIPAADTRTLSMLDKNALQLRCSAKTSKAADYRQCIAAQFESIVGTSPTFLPVSTAARVVTTAKPKPAESVINKTVETIAARSVKTDNNDQIAENTSTTINATDISKPVISNTKPSTIEPVAQADTQTTRPAVPLPRNITPAQAASELNPESTPRRTTNTLRDATGSQTATLEADSGRLIPVTGTERVISRPELVRALEDQARAKAQGIEPSTPTSALTAEAVVQPEAPTETQVDAPDAQQAPGNKPDAMKPLKDVWASLLASIASLDRVGWLILAGALALPALILGILSISRRTRPQIEAAPINNVALTERIEPGMQTRKARHEREAAQLFDDEPLPAVSAADEQTRLAPKPAKEQLQNSATSEEPEQFAATEVVPPAESVASTETSEAIEEPVAETQDASINEPANDAYSHAPAQWQSAFGQWLTAMPPERQLQNSIEFLVYWCAYGDDRFEPELKKKLFTATDLNEQDQVKRWALKQDVFAFADVISWLQMNASQSQRQQIISLIMALLITENSVTPLQNTLLRFLSDAFNVGKESLERQFEQAFGHELPPVPRVDRTAWWAKQDFAEVGRWNSREMATRTERDQMLARLGLGETHAELDVIASFRRAARRCHPDRFTDLEDRQRALAEQRFTSFEQARDYLLGVSV